MGPRLGLITTRAIIIVALCAILPVYNAYADRVTSRGASLPRAQAKSIAPPPPVAALALSGTYALTSIGARPVRNAALAQSTVIFSPNGTTSFTTSCTTIATILQARKTSHQILGFGQPVQTSMACVGPAREPEATILRLMSETTNIARAGQTITFFNAVGSNIAQWSAIAPARPASVQEQSAPQPGAPSPTRAYFGDFVLSEIDGSPLSSPSARTARPPRGMPDIPEAAPPTRAAPARIVGSLPTLFVRENGRIMGSSGCNQYNSALIRSPAGQMRFGPVITTKRACLDRSARDIEAGYLQALRGATRVDISASRVDLYAANGSRLARLSAIGPRATSGPSLYGNTWILRRINNRPVTQSDPPTLTFTNNRADGATGCGNQYYVQHHRTNGRSRFSDIIMTEKGCGDAARNQLQNLFVGSFDKVTLINITATTLTLSSPDNQIVMVFDAE